MTREVMMEMVRQEMQWKASKLKGAEVDPKWQAAFDSVEVIFLSGEGAVEVASV